LHIELISISVTDYRARPVQPRLPSASLPSVLSDAVMEYDSAASSLECPSKTTVLWLSVTCAMLVTLYACTVLFVCARRYAARTAKQKTDVSYLR
jgi:hypothetical protein